MNIDFKGKVVVVTGAGGLICGAMARAFAQSGAHVAALDLNEEAVKKYYEPQINKAVKNGDLKPLEEEITETTEQEIIDEYGTTNR